MSKNATIQRSKMKALCEKSTKSMKKYQLMSTNEKLEKECEGCKERIQL